VQLRHQTALTSEDYVRQEYWRQASLDCCPLHPRGGCGFARHGTYPRVEPPGTQISRWYCPTGHTTFSLLPDCLASQLSGSLDEVEQVVAIVEAKVAAGESIEKAAEEIRPDIELPGAVLPPRPEEGKLHRLSDISAPVSQFMAPIALHLCDDCVTS
jgi:hypothetical protein